MKKEYDWNLKDANFTKDKGTVFSCFSCGGGSTMGYKLAGFDVIGCCEIDPKMMDMYKLNHNPKYSFLMGVQDFAKLDEYPDDLYNLDILDGSPPCSSFSMAGNRDKDWGKKKRFREGQVEQVLDTLFFDFIDLAKKLQPKVVIAENVKGLLLGDAIKYVAKIITAFDKAGYYVDYKLLNAKYMGVPQSRPRVFFYAIRKDLKCKFIDLFKTCPQIDLNFNEKGIPYSEIRQDVGNNNAFGIYPAGFELWKKCRPGQSLSKHHPKGSYFSSTLTHPDKVLHTITSNKDSHLDHIENRYLFTKELVLASSFPQDYDFNGNVPKYVLGMSVPPLMTKGVAEAIYTQWLVPNGDLI